jgi:hypothetical protein
LHLSGREKSDVARENLIRGASQIKLALHVGVSSNFDPVEKAEIKAAVADAESCGAYVTVRG